MRNVRQGYLQLSADYEQHNERHMVRKYIIHSDKEYCNNTKAVPVVYRYLTA